MNNERIDLTQFEGLATREGSPSYRAAYYSAEKILPDLIAELKRCYEEIDKLRGALRVWSPIAELTIKECSKPQE